MAARPTHRIVTVAAEVLALGRTVGIKAARAAQPLVARALGAVRSRVEPPVSSPAPLDPDPRASVPSPAVTAAVTPAVTPLAPPTPRTVAKNIAPHPPAPRPSAGGTAKKRTTAPGAKLPVRKAPPGPGAGA